MGFELMYFALLRVSEVCDLKVRDINFDERVIRVFEGKTGDRNVKIGPEFAAELAAHVKGLRPDAPVVSYDRDEPYDRDHFDYRMQKYSRMAGIDVEIHGRPHSHMLRHSGARESLRNGILTIEELRVQLGHSFLSTTAIYLRTDGEGIGDLPSNR